MTRNSTFELCSDATTLYDTDIGLDGAESRPQLHEWQSLPGPSYYLGLPTPTPGLSPVLGNQRGEDEKERGTAETEAPNNDTTDNIARCPVLIDAADTSINDQPAQESADIFQ